MKNHQRRLIAFLGAIGLVVGSARAAASQERDSAANAIAAMNSAARAEVAVTRSSRTGLATFLAPPRGRSIPVPELTASTPQARAMSFVRTYGAAFGLRGAGDVLVSRASRDSLGIDHVRMRQVRSGIPVTGGELILHLRGNQVLAANGKTLDKLDGVSLEATVTALGATNAARQFLLRRLNVSEAQLSEPRLEIFNHGLLNGRDFPTRLAWFVEARGEKLREFIWVDARSRTVLLNFSQLAEAKNRAVYNGNNTSALPGTPMRSEGAGATGDTDADLAYNFSGDTYDYYLNNHGRDSFDGSGAQLTSTVHHCPSDGPCPYGNAFWNGVQMVYGNGFSSADDVVAHELTHAVTERTANLFYYMQSGALNESFSDIFGETVDLLNSAGNDAGGVRWQLGEDLSTGAIRNMMNPTLFLDPGKMSDPQFDCELAPVVEDAGGVHGNSGVPNHAYALMVDGGTYNGFTVNPLGLAKAGKIQYRALSQYLISSSDFLDNFNALQQACTDLIGTAGITIGDCSEVQKALNAVQMANPWPCSPSYGFNAARPALCSAGQVPVNTFLDNFETGISNWSISGTPGTWFRTSNPLNPLGGAAFATSGVDSLWGYNQAVAADSRAALAFNLSIPAGARLQFNHSYGFENGASTNWDGGVVEYSTNGGASWNDMAPLHAAGASYGGSISTADTNPLAGRSAFVKDSFGYTASQYDLAGLSGQTGIRFRFRIGSDSLIDDYGWFIDDFRVYTCVEAPSPTPPTISINDVTLTEGDAGSQTATFTVSLSAPSTLTVTVSAVTANNTAGAGADFIATGPTLLTFAPGVTTQALLVPVLGDLRDEFDETFVVNLSSPTNATLLDAQGLGSIVDNDPPPALSISDASVTEGDSSSVSMGFVVSLSAISEKTVTVFASTAPNTATPGADYTTIGPTLLTFSPGVASQGFSVPVLGGVLSEATETLFVNLTGATNAAIVDAQGVGTVLDNDPLPMLSISDEAVPEGDSGSIPATFTVSLSAVSGQTITVSAMSADNTATAGVDYTATGPTTLTFAPGVTTQTFSVPVLGDLASEASEILFVNLTSAVHATIADGQGVGTIVDDDTGAPTATNNSAATARAITVNSSARTGLGGPDPEVWYRTTLFANRSYQLSAWPVADDGATGAVQIFMDIFSDPAGTTPVSPAARSVVGALEGSPNEPVGMNPQTQTFEPFTTGTYRIRLTGVSATSEDVSLMLRETTLFSPWFFTSPGGGYDGYHTIHNNTAEAVSVTLTAFDASGNQVGSRITFSVPANATVFKSSVADLGVASGFGGAVLTHDGAYGAVSANTTTLSTLTGLSFDSPFTSRSPVVLGLPIR